MSWSSSVIEQRPAGTALRCVAGLPFIVTVELQDQDGDPLPGVSDVTAGVFTLAGQELGPVAPDVTNLSTGVYSLSWTGDQTGTIGQVAAHSYSFGCEIDSDGPYAILAGGISATPPNVAGSSTATTLPVAVTVGGGTVQVMVALGGGGGSLAIGDPVTDATEGALLGADDDGNLVSGPDTSYVVTVSSGTPTDGQVPVFTGVGNETTPGAGGGANVVIVADGDTYGASNGDLVICEGSATINLPALAAGSQVSVVGPGFSTVTINAAGEDEITQGHGSSGTLAFTTAQLIVLVGNELPSEGPPQPTWIATPPLPQSLFFGAAPLPTGAVLGEPAVWSVAANNGAGGWVQDATISLLVEYHSSTDSGDILVTPPAQILTAKWTDTAQSTPQSTAPLVGYIDHLPADGHAGPQLTYLGLSPNESEGGAQEFDIELNGNGGVYGVIRLDGTASCLVPVIEGVNVPTTLDGSGYNADSTLMDWDGALIQGTDLSADDTNNWIHSAAGGLVFIFSTFFIAPTVDDFPPFA